MRVQLALLFAATELSHLRHAVAVTHQVQHEAVMVSCYYAARQLPLVRFVQVSYSELVKCDFS